jgi:hypothetical protein
MGVYDYVITHVHGNILIWRRYQLHPGCATTRCTKTSRMHIAKKKKREIENNDPSW